MQTRSRFRLVMCFLALLCGVTCPVGQAADGDPETPMQKVVADGESLLSDEDGDVPFRLHDRGGDADSLRVVEGGADAEGAGAVLQVRVHTRPEADWHVRLAAHPSKDLEAGDVILLTFLARAEHAVTEQNEASVNVQLVGSKPARAHWIVHDISIPTVWKRYFISGRVGAVEGATTFAPEDVTLQFLLGRNIHTVSFSDIRMLRYPAETPLDTLPVTVETWRGREVDAPWRVEAEARIRRLRMAPLEVVVLDGEGAPLEGAAVRVEMQRHAFLFGTAVNAHGIFAEGERFDAYRAALLEHFNAAVMENAMKMPAWKARPERAREAVSWLRGRGFVMRGHCAVWPSWKWLPEDLHAMRGDREAVRGYVRDHVADVVSAFRGGMVHWDVVNEPFHNRDLMELLGEDEVAVWFRIANEADPQARLYLNECQILATAGQVDTQQQAHFEGWVRRLQGAGVPIGGIGMQGHFGNVVTPPETLLEILDRFAELGLPIVITEFDHITSDEEAQADFLRDILTVVYSHPAVDTFMMWGFWDGMHWRGNAPLFRRDWTPKPALAVWRSLLYDAWWTEERGVTDASGRVAVGGHLGTYRIGVEREGYGAVEEGVELGKGGGRVEVRLRRLEE